MIFYYTATGNCLYVARQIEEDLYSIPQELKKEDLRYKADKIGIVAPIYAGNKKLPPVYGHAAAVFPGSCSDNSARFLHSGKALPQSPYCCIHLR